MLISRLRSEASLTCSSAFDMSDFGIIRETFSLRDLTEHRAPLGTLSVEAIAVPTTRPDVILHGGEAGEKRLREMD